MHTNLSLVLEKTDDREGAIQHLRQAIAICRDTGSVYHEGIAVGNLGGMLLRAGRPSEAEPEILRGISIMEKNWPVAAAAFRGNLAALLSDQGRLDEALAMLDHAESEIRGTHPFLRLQIVAYRAQILWNHGELDQARVAVSRWLELVDEYGAHEDAERQIQASDPELRDLVIDVRNSMKSSRPGF